MSTQLANQIAFRMKAKNLSISNLEKEAGLKNHSVRNILRGKSRRPNAETLLAVAQTLGCTIQDLLTKHEAFALPLSSEAKNKVFKEKYRSDGLIQAVIAALEGNLREQKKTLNVRQFLSGLEEIYAHALQNDGEINPAYVSWFVDLLKD